MGIHRLFIPGKTDAKACFKFLDAHQRAEAKGITPAEVNFTIIVSAVSLQIALGRSGQMQIETSGRNIEHIPAMTPSVLFDNTS